MQLTAFQIFNYRSIENSGFVNLNEKNALVGRNESGKTNILLALHSLNPPEGLKPLSYLRDFPRWKSKADFNEQAPMLKTWWLLSETEQLELGKIFPRAINTKEICIERSYQANRHFTLLNLPALEVNKETIEKQLRGFERHFKNLLKDHSDKITIEKAARSLNILVHEVATGLENAADWAIRILKIITVFRQSCQPLKLEISDAALLQLQNIEDHAKEIISDAPLFKQALQWLESHLPVFIYLNEYPQLKGHQNLRSFLQHSEKNQLDESEQNFLKLCKVAELEPSELSKYLMTDYQYRQLLTNRAGAIVTQKIRNLWKDRPLKVRFHLDAEHFDTLIADPNDVYDVEINLDERSRGFKWFFSFYIMLAADAENKPAFLLLDEPALHLHASAQQDLMTHFSEYFNNQLIYTTHSPFMIAPNAGTVHTVFFDHQQHTCIGKIHEGDLKTRFPLQISLSQQLITQLFEYHHISLIVEELSDYLYLQTMYEFLKLKKPNLPLIQIFPAGGTTKIAQMAALLNLYQSKIVILGTGFKQLPEVESIEELLDPIFFNQLVKESYKIDCEPAQISLKQVAYYQTLFEQRGLHFQRLLPAQIFVKEFKGDERVLNHLMPFFEHLML